MNKMKRIIASAAALMLAAGGIFAAADMPSFLSVGGGAVMSAKSADIGDISVSGQVSHGSSNLLSKYMTRWTTPNTSYLQANSDGTISRITAYNGTVYVDSYNADYAYISTQELEYALPVWGGYYCGSEYNFCLFGQNNPDEDDSLEVMRIVKYTKDWEVVGEESFYGCNTTIPFDAGTPRMYEENGMLYIHTSHEMYASSDGYNHQANFQIHLDIESMSCIYSFYDVLNVEQTGYVSHSFDQYIRAEGDTVYTVDLGDAAPRCVALCKKDSAGAMESNVSAWDITGERGDNTTGVSLSGFELSENSCIIAGNSMLQDGTAESTNIRNIFLSITDKALSETTTLWLTDYTDAYRVSVPKLVKLDAATFLVMWNEYTDTDGEIMRAVKIDEDGNILEEVTMKVPVTMCDPIVVGDEIVWNVDNGTTSAMYHMDFSDITVYEGIEAETEATEESTEDSTDEVIEFYEDEYGNYWNFISYDDHVLVYACLNNGVVVEIPSEYNSLPVTIIDYSAFYGLETLEEVIVPETITYIDSGAFYGCTSLISVTIENPECEIYDSSNVFPEGTVIRGYEGSAAQTYAEKYGFEFEAIDVTTETGSDTEKEPVYGDADLDGTVTIADVVLIMCHASNKEKNPLSDEAINNSDVYQRGDGISVSDALSVQKKLAQVISELPESKI